MSENTLAGSRSPSRASWKGSTRSLAAGVLSRQHTSAWWYPAAVLEHLEALILEEGAVYLRLYSWWILLQCWGTLRFADHRGLSPGDDLKVSGNALTARLVHSKTIGTDRTLSHRLVVISETLRQETRLVIAWLALSQHEGGFSERLLGPDALGESQRLPTS